MVDFSKRLGPGGGRSPVDPVELYDTLDRASDKGPLRPAQMEILNHWHSTFRSKCDVIIKLHTGQGKTLIGLLILQAKLNEGKGPAVYLCPNNFLIKQTAWQAEQFGVPFTLAAGDLPAEFLDGKKLLITSVQKLFNGLSKFGMGNQSLPVGSLLMDDSHACVDAIRDSFVIRLNRGANAYSQLLDLFDDALQSQGAGDHAEIRAGESASTLPVPYWDWRDRHAEVVGILAKHTNMDEVKFAWPLLKNRMQECQCVFSGESLEISPYLPPLDAFGSYWKANHRVFMSATVTDDSFLVKGLRLTPEVIRGPLVYKEERWSGEKMVLIPSLIDASLTRDAIVAEYAPIQASRRQGLVILTPSFRVAEQWKEKGAKVATKESIYSDVEQLRNGHRDSALAIASRYDGIDLPDDVCRTLVFDSKPHAENLIDRYHEACRPSSLTTEIRVARTVEQGMGRSVRGEKDYCVIILTGADLVKTVRARASRAHLSSQTRTQIEIGLEIAEMARSEIEKGNPAIDVLKGLVRQCLKRDPDWKQFYVEKMDTVVPAVGGGEILDVFQHELDAEMKYASGDTAGAVEVLHRLCKTLVKDPADQAWYKQEMARYTHATSKADGIVLQLEAHRINPYLMKPRDGVRSVKLEPVAQKRVALVIAWAQSHGTHEELGLAVEDILDRLSFGVKAEKFEQAFHELGESLGFVCQRPDKQWKAGPDNLWGLQAGDYLLVEAKNEVKSSRPEIFKAETGQMNNACAWFISEYPGASATKILVHPSNTLANAAGFVEQVQVMRKDELDQLKKNVRDFFAEFRALQLADLAEAKVQALLNQHHLSVAEIKTRYSIEVRG